MLNRLIPNVFYTSLADGLRLFVDNLGFRVLHQDEVLAVVERDFAKAHLVQSAEFAAGDRPQITLETDAIEAEFAAVSARCPEYLHPNAATVTARPWGAREFAVRDTTGVCIVFRQW